MTPGWRMLAACGLAFWALRGRGPRLFLPDPRRCAWLFAGAAALRAVFGVWGPYHHNGQGPDWVWMAVAGTGSDFYGPGFHEVVGWIRWLPMAPDLSLFSVNLLLSAAAPVLMLAMVTALAGRGRAADLAAGVAAVDPFLARYAASEAHFSAITALVAAAMACLAWAGREAEAGRKKQSLLLAAAAGLFASQAMRVHPIAWPPAGLGLLAAAGLAGRAGAGKAWLRLTGTAAAVAGLDSAPILFKVLLRVTAPRGDNPVPLAFVTFHDERMWPWMAASAAAAVVLVFLSRGRRPAAALVGSAWTVMVVTHGTYIMSRMFSAGHDRLYFPHLLAGLALLLPARLGRLSLLALPVWVVVVLAAYSPAIYRRNTEQLEYAFLREAFKAVPEGCRIVFPGPAAHPVLRVPSYVGAKGWRRSFVDTGVVSEEAFLGAIAGPGCRYYVRTSVCAYPEYARLCGLFERFPGLRLVAGRRLPARPSTDCWPYPVAEVETAVFKVE
ncbi:MAG: hypothetical protein WC943_11560 [Elusimicrobiota bacterium]